MQLNTLKPAPGSRVRARRVGRGIGSGLGKTCGRGHKGQTARTGGKIRPGFEGGQQPLQRRLPKVGFNSRSKPFVAEIRLHEIAKIEGSVASMETLRAAGLIGEKIERVKVILAGEIARAITVSGLGVTSGAKAAIEAAGGKVEA
ncbi:MAG: 50S ribosomal protein L15 [Gammaproteobacteria bacterium]|nr:50S ribosomal protein L15 [Gammaproteobacteria bacterium]